MSGPTILGLGQISACGSGIGALGEALTGGPPQPEWLTTTPGPSGQEFPVLVACREGLEGLVPARAVRRLDRFTTGFVLASRLALDHAGLDLPGDVLATLDEISAPEPGYPYRFMSAYSSRTP